MALPEFTWQSALFLVGLVTVLYLSAIPFLYREVKKWNKYYPDDPVKTSVWFYLKPRF